MAARLAFDYHLIDAEGRSVQILHRAAGLLDDADGGSQVVDAFMAAYVAAEPAMGGIDELDGDAAQAPDAAFEHRDIQRLRGRAREAERVLEVYGRAILHLQDCSIAV